LRILLQANSADFRIAAKLLEVQNPFDVVPVRSPAARHCLLPPRDTVCSRRAMTVPCRASARGQVTIGALPPGDNSSGGDTLVVWTRAEFAEGGSSVVFKPFVEVVFAGTCVLVAYNQGAPVHLVHPIQIVTPWWLEKPLVGRSLDGGALAFAWMDERFDRMHHSTSVPGAGGKSRPSCAVCGRPSTHGCPHCGLAYCHSLCQREDWSRHRLECEHHPSSHARVDARGRPLFWSKMAALTLGVSRQENNNATLFRECVAIGVSASVLTATAAASASGEPTAERPKKKKVGAKKEKGEPEVVVVADDDGAPHGSARHSASIPIVLGAGGDGLEPSAPDLVEPEPELEPIDDVVARINSAGAPPKKRCVDTATAHVVIMSARVVIMSAHVVIMSAHVVTVSSPCRHVLGAGKKQRAPATASKGMSRGARVREARKRNQETETETTDRQLRALLR
jgi:hypothetical protein